jgi:FAD-linked sulfhydryl oxidase
MPLTELLYPILSQFFCIVEKRTGQPAMPLERDSTQHGADERGKELPKGVVLGPDGKPYAWSRLYQLHALN